MREKEPPDSNTVGRNTGLGKQTWLPMLVLALPGLETMSGRPARGVGFTGYLKYFLSWGPQEPSTLTTRITAPTICGALTWCQGLFHIM